MKKQVMMVMMVVAGIAALPMSAWAATGSTPPSSISNPLVPGQVNFQGILRNPSTGALYTNGIYTIEFRLFTSISGGSKALWGDTYSVYVRDGYFNVMLGEKGSGISGSDTPTYTGTALWKALWYNGSNAELWLDVTPYQDSSCNPIAAENRKAISPRQKLLTAPFAFRAESAEYAQKSQNDFSVGRNLTVKGDLTIEGASSGLALPHVGTSTSELTLGKSNYGSSKVTMQGDNVNLKASSGMAVTPGGDLTVTMGSSKNLKVTGGNLSLSPNGDATTTMKSGKTFKVSGGNVNLSGSTTTLSGSTTMNLSGGAMKLSGSTMDVTCTTNVTIAGGKSQLTLTSGCFELDAYKGNTLKGNLYVNSDGDARLYANKRITVTSSGSDVNVESTSGNVYVSAKKKLDVSGETIYGEGKLWWKDGSDYNRPFILRKIDVKTSSSHAELEITSNANYSWSVVGVDVSDKSYDAHAAVIQKGGRPYVKVYGRDSETVTVHLLGINPALVNENRW